MASTSKANRESNNRKWLISVGIIAGFSVLLIIGFPSFYADEFPIFGEIALHPEQLLKTDPKAEYHLFVRPISHVVLWLYFHGAGTNAIVMKCFNLALLLLLLYVVGRFLLTFQHADPKKPDTLVVALLLLWLGTHPSLQHSVLFISNITELLSALFYATALLFVTRMWDAETGRGGTTIFLAISAFIASILSKQTGLHLPLTILLLALLTGRWRGSTERKRTILFSLISGVIAVLFAVFNYVFLVHGDWTPWKEILWRVPFRIANSLVYIFLPLYANELHYFFSSHKALAVALAVGGLIILLVVLRKARFLRASRIGWVILGLSVYLPLVLVAVGDRLQTIPLLWVVIGGAYLSDRVPSHVFSAAIGILILLNIIASAQLPTRLERVARYADQVCSELLRVSSGRKTEIIISDPYLGYDPSYMAYFQRTGKFGKDDHIGYPRIHSWIPVYWDAGEAELRRRFTVYRKGDTIVATALSKASIILPTHRTGKILQSRLHSRFTGFESITFLREEMRESHERICLYWNGDTWEEIE